MTEELLILLLKFSKVRAAFARRHRGQATCEALKWRWGGSVNRIRVCSNSFLPGILNTPDADSIPANAVAEAEICFQ